MLAYYAERFTTVEINYTFYRMPTPKLLAGWARGTPEHFPFTLKAPRRITHDAELQRCEDRDRQAFCRTAQTLGPKLGALLFQLPPNFKGTTRLLDASSSTLLPRRRPGGVRVPARIVARARRYSPRCGPATSRSASPTARR